MSARTDHQSSVDPATQPRKIGVGLSTQLGTTITGIAEFEYQFVSRKVMPPCQTQLLARHDTGNGKARTRMRPQQRPERTALRGLQELIDVTSRAVPDPAPWRVDANRMLINIG